MNDKDSAFNDFRWNRNVISVRSEEDYELFRRLLEEFDPDILDDLDQRARNFAYACHIIDINHGDSSFLMFEAKDSGEYGVSVTWTGADDYYNNCDYYGIEPIEISEL